MVRMDRTAADFRGEIHSHILTQLAQRPHTFQSLLEKGNNCDPLFLLETLRDLQTSNEVHLSDNGNGNGWYCLANGEKTAHVQENTGPSKKILAFEGSGPSFSGHFRELLKSILSSLPEASPIYSQWWFSDSVYDRLIGLLRRLNRKGGPVGFIGSSTLGSLFSHFYRKPVHIFDVDRQLLQTMKNHCSKQAELIEHDVSNVSDKQFKARFQVVFVDPPWSSSLLRTFFVKSSTFVSTGGMLAISLPQRFTRPSVITERKELLKSASNLGLSLKIVLPNFTEYSVPLFEYIAYKKSGIHLEKPWRKGDLFIFTKIKESNKQPTDSPCKPAYWEQYSHNKFRLFLKRDSLFEDGLPKVEPLSGLEDFTYYCTSSRTPAWKSASLVSSRNHVAQAYGRTKLAECFARVFSKKPTVNSASSCSYDTAIKTFLYHILDAKSENVLESR